MIELLLADGSSSGSAWPLLGRLHPLIIHFPIAMILTAAAVELCLVFSRNHRPSSIAGFCLWIGTIGACLATWTGWSFGEEHGSGTTLELHRWFGVAASGILLGVAVCWCIERSSQVKWSFHAYRFGLWAGTVLIVVTSFFGGEMVWGSGYFFDEQQSAPTPAPATPAVEEEAGAGLQAQASVIIEARCASCHGPEKQKGRLQLYPLATAFPADRKAKWVVIPGDPDASKLIERVVLPADHDDIMPPKGEPLNAEQVDVLKEWISEGAPHDAVPVEASAPTASAAPVPEAGPKIEPGILGAALAAVEARGGLVSPRHRGSPWYELNASLARPAWSDEDLELLTPLEPVLWRLDLGGSDVTDAGMPLVGRCIQLRTLKLERTGVADAGLSDLRKLVHLESLNLFGTDVTDAGLPAVESLPALRSLYLWDTKVQAGAVDDIRLRRPALDIELGGTFVAGSTESAPSSDSGVTEEGAGGEPPVSGGFPACCLNAEARGGECDHACCVAARSQGLVCQNCPK